MTPYNTGKVKIGCAYRRQRCSPSEPDQLIQKLLLDKPQPRKGLIQTIARATSIVILFVVAAFVGATIH